ncbi:MAG: ribosome assembly cofactor RimP [Bacteroidales bacterium]|nr:ribosome assembly cofactor RimP [Bacteroidales bacterium]
MIDKNLITSLVEEHCNGKEIYPVEITVSINSKITVFIDADQGVAIANCVALSRFIEGSLNREEHDFELEVTSAGLDQPFKIPRQYLKNLGRKVKVSMPDGTSLIGILHGATDKDFTLEVEKKVQLEGSRKKTLVKEEITLEYQNIQSTKIEISFK